MVLRRPRPGLAASNRMTSISEGNRLRRGLRNSRACRVRATSLICLQTIVVNDDNYAPAATRSQERGSGVVRAGTAKTLRNWLRVFPASWVARSGINRLDAHVEPLA